MMRKRMRNPLFFFVCKKEWIVLWLFQTAITWFLCTM